MNSVRSTRIASRRGWRNPTPAQSDSWRHVGWIFRQGEIFAIERRAQRIHTRMSLA